MMDEERDYRSEGQDALQKLRRQRDQIEQKAESLKAQLQKTLKAMKHNEEGMNPTKQQLAQLMNDKRTLEQAVREAGGTMRGSQGYGVITESDPTGYEPRPWDNEGE